MLAELERLIRLQEIETRAAEARRTMAEAPGRIEALDAKLAAARAAVAAAKQALADNQAGRRTLEKDQIAVQQRLEKYKEQLMAVKTNTEYHAMQAQIAATGEELGKVEEQILVNMMTADEQTAALKKAEAALKADEAAVAAERKAIEDQAAAMQQVATQSDADRAALVPQIERAHLEMFERVYKARAGVAVATEAAGLCSVCHVRLRPQVVNTIRRNEAIVQCDSCQRIMYFVPPKPAEASA